MTSTFVVTWPDFHYQTCALATQIKSVAKWDAMLAVTRGGLIPAGILAKALNIRYIDTICIASYQDKKQTQMQIFKQPTQLPKRLLIVDDIVDTGDTACVVRELFPDADYVSVYAKPSGVAFTNYFQYLVTQETWVEFPWDTSPMK